jgi:hypothetical protein
MPKPVSTEGSWRLFQRLRKYPIDQIGWIKEPFVSAETRLQIGDYCPIRNDQTYLTTQSVIELARGVTIGRDRMIGAWLTNWFMLFEMRNKD